MQKNNSQHYLHLHFIVFVWGFTAILGKLVSLEAISLVWWRMLIATFFIGIYMQFFVAKNFISNKDKLLLLLSGSVIALHWFTFFHAIKVSNISITLACLSTGAFFVSLIEPFVLKKKIKFHEIIFGLFALLGLYFVVESVEPNFFQKSFSNNISSTLLGVFLALISAFLSALFSVINSLFVKRLNPTSISYYELIGGVMFFSLISLFVYSNNWGKFIPKEDDWIWLVILSTICTAYAFIASVSVMKHISAFTVMLTINLEPIYGIVLAFILFNDEEKMSPMFYVGALIILITVILNGIVSVKFKKE